MERTWKDIPGFEGLYQASDRGEIRTKPGKTTSNKRYAQRTWKTRILKQKFRKNGVRRDAAVTLWKDGYGRDYLVSRLVASAWVGGYDPRLTVNHIDGNPLNNCANNLEWVTLSENIKKGFEDGLYDKVQSETSLSDGERDFHFRSMAAASRFLGHSSGYISMCLKRSTPIRDIYGKEYAVIAHENEVSI